MDAQDRHDLNSQVENLLLAIGPALRKQPSLFRQAAAIFASIISNKVRTADSRTIELFNAGIDLRHGKPAPVVIPPAAAGQFPFNKPTPLLRDQIHQIEAMLAPLSDKRARAHHIGLRLKV